MCLEDETRDYFVGPMPVNDFMHCFLEWPATDYKDLEYTPDFSGMHIPIGSMCQLFVSLGHIPSFCSSTDRRFAVRQIDSMKKLSMEMIDFVDTSKSGDTSWLSHGLAPTISGYTPGSGLRAAKFAAMHIWGELKNKRQDDPFNDPPKTATDRERAECVFLGDSDGHRKTLGQLISYAVAQMGSSFRTHCFSFFVAGDTVRFIRWDRGGVIVTEALNYVENPKKFAEFFRRFDRLTPAQRGLDQTVTEPTAEELVLAKAALMTRENVTEITESSKDRNALLDEATYYKFSVREPGASEPSYFIGALFPSQIPDTLVSRATHGLPVYNLQTKEVNFMKDTWRADKDDLISEGDTYKLLHEKGVKHIIPLVSYGDVYLQSGVRAVSTLPYSPPSNRVAPRKTKSSGSAREKGQSSLEVPGDIPVHVGVPGIASVPALPTPPATIASSPEQSPAPPGEPRDTTPPTPTRPPVAQSNGTADAGSKRATRSGYSSAQPQSSKVRPRTDSQLDDVHVSVSHRAALGRWAIKPRRGPNLHRLHRYIHHRLVLEKVCRALTRFRSTKEMVTAVRDAIEGARLWFYSFSR